MHVEYVVVRPQPQAQPQPQPQPRQAMPNQELLKVTIEVLDLAEQVLEKEQDRSGQGAQRGPLWRQGAQERLRLSLSWRHKIPLNIFSLN